jgi:hypothetical protein
MHFDEGMLTDEGLLKDERLRLIFLLIDPLSICK